MLRRLYIRDFVIVDQLELDFQSGFGALTGETGAGKSILIDALNLALGERGDAGVVRSGKDKAEVCAEFDVEVGSPLLAWLADNDFDSETDTILLRRIIDNGGRSRAYINGATATLAQLKAAAEWLCDIHGQHAHHSLLRADAQRHLIDSHAGLLPLTRDVAAHYKAWQAAREARLQAERDSEASRKERDLLEWQVKELTELGFSLDDWQETNQDHARLSHAASLISGADAAVEALDSAEISATSLIDHVLGPLKDLAEVDAALKEPVAMMEEARIQLNEAAHTLARYSQRLDVDPERLAELETRLANVTTLARKHRVQPEGLPELQREMGERLESLRLQGDPAALAAREKAAEQSYQTTAKQLSAGRTKVAAELTAQITAAMQGLAMAGGRFEIALLPQEAGASYGLENVEFRVAANAGQSPRAMAKVASGGELSRIGLAIQVITSQSGEVPTLIFDEVDVGIGGSVAEIVGRLLKQLGEQRQVLCVTHLPQVASQAHSQWSIAKETRDGLTLSSVTPLDQDGRINEIARMLGGVKITETTRDHAREMLGYTLAD